MPGSEKGFDMFAEAALDGKDSDVVGHCVEFTVGASGGVESK